MPLVTSFQELISNSMHGLTKGASVKIPSLQSDYVIGIIPSYKENVNASDFDGVLITSLGTEYLQNGFSMNKSSFGFSSANMSFSANFTFSFIGMEYTAVNKERGTAAFTTVRSDEENILTKSSTRYSSKVSGYYPSLIHYYYQQQLTETGTLRLKTKGWSLPAVYIFNMRTSKPVYVLIDCRFSQPTFTTSPTSNELITYQTTVYYNSYKDLLSTTLNEIDHELAVTVDEEVDRDSDEYSELLDAGFDKNGFSLKTGSGLTT